MRSQNHVISRSKILKNVCNVDQTLPNYDSDHLIHTLLYGSKKFNFNLNKEIVKLAVWYLKDTERFDESLIWNIYFLLLLLLYYYCYQYYYYYCYYYYIIISLC